MEIQTHKTNAELEVYECANCCSEDILHDEIGINYVIPFPLSDYYCAECYQDICENLEEIDYVSDLINEYSQFLEWIGERYTPADDLLEQYKAWKPASIYLEAFISRWKNAVSTMYIGLPIN